MVVLYKENKNFRMKLHTYRHEKKFLIALIIKYEFEKDNNFTCVMYNTYK